MSDHRRTEGIADITHAVLVHSVGSTRIQSLTAPDGGPVYVLTLVGQCQCRADDAELERTMLLRDADLVNIVAALTDAARQTPLGDSLADLVETVIDLVRDRVGERSGRGGQLISVCSHCGVGDGPCNCTGWTTGPGHG